MAYVRAPRNASYGRPTTARKSTKTPAPTRNASPAQIALIQKLATERDVSGLNLTTPVASLTIREASQIIDALFRAPELPQVAAAHAVPGYYTVVDNAETLHFVVVENKTKTGTYAKQLVIGNKRARWVYSPGAAAHLARGGHRPLTLDEAAQLGKKHGVCIICGHQLTDDVRKGPDGLTSIERGIGPDCAETLRRANYTPSIPVIPVTPAPTPPAPIVPWTPAPPEPGTLRALLAAKKAAKNEPTPPQVVATVGSDGALIARAMAAVQKPLAVPAPKAAEPTPAKEPEIAPCGCPVQVIADSGHQEGCVVRDPIVVRHSGPPTLTAGVTIVNATVAEPEPECVFEHGTGDYTPSSDACAGPVTFAADPYQADIYNDDTPVWMCERHRDERYSDI